MYGTLAKFYDLFMQDVPYEKWIEFVAEKIGTQRKYGVDFGCGTGRFTFGLAQKGYEILGVDLSGEMLNVAFVTAQKQGLKVPFLQGDICNFLPAHPLDFAIAMCDTVNYIKNPSDAFANVYKNLKSGGIFIFDLSSAFKLKTILAGQTYSETEDDITYIWSSCGGKKRIDMELTFFEPVGGGLYRKSSETQTQYIHESNEICAALNAAGFVRVKCLGRLSKRAPKADETRIHFIATKK